MAKKNKDDIDDNDDLNEGNSGDINDADDNFGLPDVEYSPVNREDEPAPEDPEPIKKRDVIYSSPAAGEETSGYSGYTPPERESNAPKILILLGVLLLIGAGIWYFAFYRPEQGRIQAQQEQQLREEQQRAEAERQAQIERERQEREAAEQEAARLAAEEAAAESKTGTFETILNRTGRYYIVVASAIDSDLATDYAKKLASEGENTKILTPKGNNKFHRVAVGDYENLAAAQEVLGDMRSRFGNDVWVVKF